MLDVIKNFLWNYMFVPMFLFAGIVCFFVILKNRGIHKKPATDPTGEVSPMQSLFVTLASTIGTGNIIGVSMAVLYGGAGAVFWMWVAAFFGMAVSYCENVLGMMYRGKSSLPVGYMPRSISKAFAIFCIMASFGMGNMTQTNSAANALYSGFGIEKWVTGAVFALLAFVIIRGGLKGITRFTDFFVPVMSIGYIVSAMSVILINRGNIANVFESIFREAFSVRAILGGAVATGIGRGVMSGEAGMGSTVILCGKSNAKSPHIQGLVGAMAIFIDTFVICTLTAIAILSANTTSTQSAFYAALGAVGGKVLDVSIAFFAFTTVIGWSYFGVVCTEYLFGEKRTDAYKLIYAAMAFVGAVMQLEVVWGVSDVSSALMAIPNLLCVIFLSGKIAQKTA